VPAVIAQIDAFAALEMNVNANLTMNAQRPITITAGFEHTDLFCDERYVRFTI
jgi:hypothetical protein